jgi:membrane protease YdiL (CAAX protease family)
MKREIKLLTLTYLLVLLSLFMSGVFEGVLSTIVYVLAFALPFCMALTLAKIPGEKSPSEYLTLSKGEALITVNAIFPLVGICFLLSYLSSLLLQHTLGVSNEANLGDSFALAVLIHALLPALLEEALFRYLPLKLIGERSPTVTLLLSAGFFALLHHSFFQIPYAFVAGLIFMAVDLMCKSVLPSLILHFLNNLLSLVWTFFVEGTTLALPFLIGIAALAVFSATLTFVLWKRLYRERAKSIFVIGEKYEAGAYPVLFALPTLFVAVSELFI